MSELVARWWELLVVGGAQALPVLALAWLLDRAFARLAWSGPRRVVWAVALVELLLPPGLGAPLHVGGRAALSVPALASAPTSAAGPVDVLFWCWLLGTALFVVASEGLGRRASRAVLRHGVAAPAWLVARARGAARRVGLRRVPRILVSSRATGPCALGALRPTVVLDPATVAGPSTALEHALLHELGHVRRRDPLRAALLRAALLAWWFHPTALLIRRRAALLRELGCDALVARALGRSGAYCRTLVARALGATPPPAAASALVGLPADVVQRTAALRAPAGRGRLRAVASCASAAALLLCCVPLACEGPGAASLPFGAASLDDLPGCLTRRYFVLGQLHASEAGAAVPSPESPSPEALR